MDWYQAEHQRHAYENASSAVACAFTTPHWDGHRRGDVLAEATFWLVASRKRVVFEFFSFSCSTVFLSFHFRGFLFSFDVVEEEDSTDWGACGGTGLRSQVSREAASDCRNAQKVQSSTLPFQVFESLFSCFHFQSRHTRLGAFVKGSRGI